MNSDTLQDILEEALPEGVFQGVFPSNQLPLDRCPRPSAYMVNFDPHYMPGSHWVALYLDRASRGYYFCSQASEPTTCPEIYEFLISKTDLVLNWSQFCIQGPGSLTCGQYATFFLYHITRGVAFHDILGTFSAKNRSLNDCHIAEWLRRKFRVSSNCHEDAQSCVAYKL